MKRKLFITSALIFASIGISSAQQEPQLDERWGEDPAKRKDNALTVNYFNDAYNTKAYGDALRYMHLALNNCPKASQNVYIYGGNIYRDKMNLATTKAERALYLDSMLWLLDRRIDAFGDHPKLGRAYLEAQKALLFNENNTIDRERAFKLFRTAVEVGGKNVDEPMSVTFFNSLTEGFKLDDLTAEEYIDDYDKLISILNMEPDDEANKKAMTDIDALFASSGAASCENIEKIFRPKYEADPNNKAQAKMILGLFSRSKCSSDFQLKLTEDYYKLEPTPELALMLAGIYEEKKDFGKSLEFINIALKGETDPAKKQQMLIRAAGATLGNGNYREAADLARQIVSIDPNSGYGYLLLANAYSGGIRGCSGFDQQAAYWLVVDTYNQARAKFQEAGDATQVSNINGTIGSYVSHFPKTEETFMRGLEPGQGYTVNCGWVSGRTTVRER